MACPGHHEQLCAVSGLGAGSGELGQARLWRVVYITIGGHELYLERVNSIVFKVHSRV